MSSTTAAEIQKFKFALLEAESRLQHARDAMASANVDILVLRERLKLAETGQELTVAPQSMPRPDLFALKIDLTAEDRRAAARVLRRLAADIEAGDATGWTVSGIEGSVVATPYTPGT